MLKPEVMEDLEREVRPWLLARGYTLRKFRALPYETKVRLHNVVCKGHPTSDRQRRELAQALDNMPESREGKLVNSESKDLEKFFEPLPDKQNDQLRYLSKF
ncbi:MAG: hypothetical protein V1894_03940 [Chloroflexota bacterium]